MCLLFPVTSSIPIVQSSTSYSVNIASTIVELDKTENQRPIPSDSESSTVKSSTKILEVTTLQSIVNLTDSLDISVKTNAISLNTTAQTTTSSIETSISITKLDLPSKPTSSLAAEDILTLKSSYNSIPSSPSSSVCAKNNKCPITASFYITKSIDVTKTPIAVSTSPLTIDVVLTTLITSSPTKTKTSVNGLDVTRTSVNVQDMTPSYKHEFISISDLHIITMGSDPRKYSSFFFMCFVNNFFFHCY